MGGSKRSAYSCLKRGPQRNKIDRFFVGVPKYKLAMSNVLAARKARRRPKKCSDAIMCHSGGTNSPPTLFPPRQKSQFIFPTRHLNTFMEPFLNYVRLWYDSDTYQNCIAYLNRVSDYSVYKAEQKLAVPFTGFYSVFTRDKKSFDIIRRCLYLNQRFRWAMKRLIYRWRIARCKPMNTEDIFTGEIPVKLIEIYDWAQKSKYVFEAATVYRDYMTKIQNASNFFVNPMMPRNPFTNSDLTYGQLHFMIRDLIHHGFNHWSFDALKKSGYSMDVFGSVYEYPLKYDNLKNVFRKPTEIACTDAVFECIESEYEYHGVALPYKHGWYVALRENPDCKIIQQWRAVSLKREQILIHYDMGPIFQSKMAVIHAETVALVRNPATEIRIIWRKYVDRQEDTEEEKEEDDPVPEYTYIYTLSTYNPPLINIIYHIENNDEWWNNITTDSP